MAIAIPLYGGMQSAAREEACRVNLRTINGAVSAYHAERREYPGTIQDLVTEGFLKEVPECPVNQNGRRVFADGGYLAAVGAVRVQYYAHLASSAVNFFLSLLLFPKFAICNLIFAMSSAAAPAFYRHFPLVWQDFQNKCRKAM